MDDCLIERFFADEANEHVVRTLLAAISAASGVGSKYFTFNVFNVLLDFELGAATVEDEFDPVAMCRVGLGGFADRLRRFDETQR
jgi:hypothetical protein